jgi:hypothetical protein
LTLDVLFTHQIAATRYINSKEVNNPSYEFWPPKNINGHNGTQIPSQFLVDTLNGNLFAHMYVLPDTTLFVVANLDAMILNWRTNTETRLPKMPNGIRVTLSISLLFRVYAQLQ